MADDRHLRAWMQIMGHHASVVAHALGQDGAAAPTLRQSARTYIESVQPEVLPQSDDNSKSFRNLSLEFDIKRIICVQVKSAASVWTN